MPQLAEFWPRYGPCCDGLGLIEPRNAFESPVILLVEAKSRLLKLRSQGCQASEGSLARFRQAMDEAQVWCGAEQVAKSTGSPNASRARTRGCFVRNLQIRHEPTEP
jgi:hypothetical protein